MHSIRNSRRVVLRELRRHLRVRIKLVEHNHNHNHNEPTESDLTKMTRVGCADEIAAEQGVDVCAREDGEQTMVHGGICDDLAFEAV